MTDSQVSLPFACLPTTDGVRTAIANVIRDIQREHDLTDVQLAGRIEVHPNTISRARNKQGTLDNEAMAKLGAIFGSEAMRPYTALWAQTAANETRPLAETATAVATLSTITGPKSELDALPTLKAQHEAMGAYILSIEQRRLRLAS